MNRQEKLRLGLFYLKDLVVLLAEATDEHVTIDVTAHGKVKFYIANAERRADSEGKQLSKWSHTDLMGVPEAIEYFERAMTSKVNSELLVKELLDEKDKLVEQIDELDLKIEKVREENGNQEED